MGEHEGKPGFIVNQRVQATKPAFVGNAQVTNVGDLGTIEGVLPPQPGLSSWMYVVLFDRGHMFRRAEFEIEAVERDENDSYQTLDAKRNVLAAKVEEAYNALQATDRLAEIRTELGDERIHYNRTGFMNMSPDDIAYLLDEIERLRAENTALVGSVEHWRDAYSDKAATARDWWTEHQNRVKERDTLAAQVAAAREALETIWRSECISVAADAIDELDALAALDDPGVNT